MKTVVPLDDEVIRRAHELQTMGLRPLCALHVASAEAAGCAYLVTTDHRLATALRRNAPALQVRLADPLQMLSILEGVEA